MTVKYDPACLISQSYLAGEIINRLAKCGFLEIDPGNECMERVFERPRTKDGDVRVVVYTSIHKVDGLVRKRGADAIRVCLVRRAKSGDDRGLVKSKRVNRVGLVGDIVDRMHERMRDCWKAMAEVKTCHKCGAPKFVTKKNKLCCSELCFRNEPGYVEKPYKKRYRRRRRSPGALR